MTANHTAVPSVAELRQVIAQHVLNLEPVATCDGTARAIHAYLVWRARGQRIPLPGEYVDPQPSAVDLAGDPAS